MDTPYSHQNRKQLLHLDQDSGKVDYIIILGKIYRLISATCKLITL